MMIQKITLLFLLLFNLSSAFSAALDVDGDGKVDALTDGILLIRHQFGFSGEKLTSGALSSKSTRTTPEAIKKYIVSLGNKTDVDGSNNIDALSDGILSIRYMFGFRGEQLTKGAISNTATRKSPDDVFIYLTNLPDDKVASGFAVQITSPKTLITVGSTPMEITGTLSEAATLTLNGVPVTANGGKFSAKVVLKEGHNTIVARAVKSNNEEVTDSISVAMDLTPPYITVDSPKEGAVVQTAKISVSGLVNDIVRGTVSDTQANVKVNGQTATVANRSYLVKEITLKEGENTITITAADQVGNIAKKEIIVTYKIPKPKKISLVSGQDQENTIATDLKAPLKVLLVDEKSQPVANEAVVFRVIQGDGVVGLGDNEGRGIVVKTDEKGIASTTFKLGSRSGTGNHRVRAKAVGFDGEVIFQASANVKPGNKVTVNSGNNQRGAPKQTLPLPFVVSVSDAGANVVKGAKVEFKVSQGKGKFQNGNDRYIGVTDSDGRASVEFSLGTEIGLDVHRVTATLMGTNLGAGFSASALKVADASLTSITGVVLDNQDKPLPSVTIRIEGNNRQAKTNTQGIFKITEVPVGPVHLLVDGSTTTAKGEWPTLSYNIVTIAGAKNPLASPVYMVSLDTKNAALVGKEDKVLTLNEVPGFKLAIKKGSVTFPDGKKEGLVSITPVNANKIPMAPPNGMQPQFIVTIQPVGTKFDPPAALTLPNVDGHKAGAQVEMYSFDHDLEEFVIIGLGTVSKDARLIESNSGVGVIKAGWHAGSQPSDQPPGCANTCSIGQSCNDPITCKCEPTKCDNNTTPIQEVGSCKRFSCENGGIKVENDKDNTPPDVEGDCKKTGSGTCNFGIPEQENDDTDNPKNDKCKSCKNGELIEFSDDDVKTSNWHWNAVDKIIDKINKALKFINIDEDGLITYRNLGSTLSKEKVCCADSGISTKISYEASIKFLDMKYKWRPKIKPYTGDYSASIFGKTISLAYGVQLGINFSGSMNAKKPIKTCENKNECWVTSLSAGTDIYAKLFGEIKNPDLPKECGENEDEQCSYLDVSGTGTTGINVQGQLKECTVLHGTVGLSGLNLNLTIKVAEGSWYGFSVDKDFEIIEPMKIAEFSYNME
ncbi:MAG: carboxypeptidase-like regulatory domain-containing protein [Methylococcales bacterium]|nr:carboxypeptidase-like regulatory domain-containing protein [Methylococcales bacterium]